MITRPFAVGDDLTVITPDGRRLVAVVRLASPVDLTQSLVLDVADGMIGPWVGLVPVHVIADDRGVLLDGIPLELDRRRPSFTCPRCGAISYNVHDIAFDYCGRCHVFVDDQALPDPGGPR
jgi:hypothetical protein